VRRLIPIYDALVRRAQGVFEFSADPNCVLRLRRLGLPWPLVLEGVVFPAGTPLLQLHLSNERIPPLPPAGPDVAWAARAARRLQGSLRALAAYIALGGPAREARLVGATTILADGAGGEWLVRRLGFECRPHIRIHSPLIERWQDRYALELMAVFNPVSLRTRQASSIRRTDLWMTTESFLQRFDGATDGAAQEPPLR
jgi:hypothetical protein